MMLCTMTPPLVSSIPGRLPRHLVVASVARAPTAVAVAPSCDGVVARVARPALAHGKEPVLACRHIQWRVKEVR